MPPFNRPAIGDSVATCNLQHNIHLMSQADSALSVSTGLSLAFCLRTAGPTMALPDAALLSRVWRAIRLPASLKVSIALMIHRASRAPKSGEKRLRWNYAGRFHTIHQASSTRRWYARTQLRALPQEIQLSSFVSRYKCSESARTRRPHIMHIMRYPTQGDCRPVRWFTLRSPLHVQRTLVSFSSITRVRNLTREAQGISSSNSLTRWMFYEYLHATL
jgi:hypothetical protein